MNDKKITLPQVTEIIKYITSQVELSNYRENSLESFDTPHYTVSSKDKNYKFIILSSRYNNYSLHVYSEITKTMTSIGTSFDQASKVDALINYIQSVEAKNLKSSKEELQSKVADLLSQGQLV